jgi:hypothetical protein
LFLLSIHKKRIKNLICNKKEGLLQGVPKVWPDVREVISQVYLGVLFINGIQYVPYGSLSDLDISGILTKIKLDY